MTGRIAVFGMGRSGLAVARAARVAGAEATVYDEGDASQRKLAEAKRQLQAEGVEVIAPWDGAFSETGATVVVTSPGVAKRHPKLLRAVEEGLPVLSEIEFAFRIARAPVIAITGTNGKSTTTVMTWLCLKAAGVDAVLCGNIFGSGYDEVPLCEAAAASRPDQVLVAEVSSFQLEWIETFRPRAAAITNISPDHLNRYRDFEEYASTKRNVFWNMADGDTAVVRAGDPQVDPRERTGLRRRRYLAMGDAPSQETLDAVEHADSIEILGRRLPKSDLPWREPYNHRNAMCAALLGSCLLPAGDEAKVDLLVHGLRSFTGLKHRMERLGERDGVTVINNSMCTNPSAVVSSSLGLEGRQHLILGGVTKELGFGGVRDHLEARGHRAYLFGRDAEKINAQLGGGWPVFTTMGEAFEAATKEAKPGDTILLAPGAASLDQFEDFRARGEAFRKLAQEWLGR